MHTSVMQMWTPTLCCKKPAISRHFKEHFTCACKSSDETPSTLFSDVVWKLSDYSRLMQWLTVYCVMSSLWSHTVLHCVLQKVTYCYTIYIRTCFEQTRPVFYFVLLGPSFKCLRTLLRVPRVSTLNKGFSVQLKRSLCQFQLKTFKIHFAQ